MRHWDAIGLADFQRLINGSEYLIFEISDSQLVLSGDYHLNAQLPGSHLIDRTYSQTHKPIKLIFPAEYPENCQRYSRRMSIFRAIRNFMPYIR